jgi:hypothetical protein
MQQYIQNYGTMNNIILRLHSNGIMVEEEKSCQTDLHTCKNMKF